MFYDWILTTSYLIIFFIFSTINFIFYLKYLWINFHGQNGDGIWIKYFQKKLIC